MIPLADLIAATQATVLAAGHRTELNGFAHDSRSVNPGDCFVAVRGIHGDGHDFVAHAIARGAGALLVERAPMDRLLSAQPDLLERLAARGASILAVSETRTALRAYAAHILATWRPTVIAVAGSTGKTTTKEAIAEVLGLRAPTFRSWRNYNDLLGLPLALGRLEPTQRFAVVEMGADHPGEIAALCAVARPRVGIVTNISPAQLQYFGSLAALTRELAQLPAALPPDGTAILSADDAASDALAAQSVARVLRFGPGTPETSPTTEHPIAATISAMAGQAVPALTLQLYADGERYPPVTFPDLHGDHWAGAILAALTVATVFDVPRAEALRALEPLCPLPGRMRWLAGTEGVVVLDDSHNATPTSAAAGLRALGAIAGVRGSSQVAVLGDMLRLGTSEEQAHQALGVQAAASVKYLVTRGRRGEMIAQAAIQAGLPRGHVAITYTAEDAARAATEFARRGAHPVPAVIYIKGSEEARMEQVTALLLAEPLRAEELLDRQSYAWQRFVVAPPDRPTWLEIDLSAIGQNTRLLKELVGPQVQLLVSLKADAYGHGALRVARTVLRNGASWLGVASINEARPLREAGIEAPILIFGYVPPWQAREAVRLDVRVTVYDAEAARAFSHAAVDLGRTARLHVKIDSGMGRLGLRAEYADAIARFCALARELPGIELEGIFTHFATADSADQTYAYRQLRRFQRVLTVLEADGLRPPLVHAANSAATLTLPEARFDMVRPGIAIYGLAPSDEVRLPPRFAPALSFKTQVAQVKDIPAGEGISYGATYITTRPMRIAVLPVGYADGFRRAPANWGEVLVRGQRAPLLGRVCMDQCMIDVTDIPAVHMGDEVVLIGQQGTATITAEEVAGRLGTIAYEVVSELLARVPRIS